MQGPNKGPSFVKFGLHNSGDAKIAKLQPAFFVNQYVCSWKQTKVSAFRYYPKSYCQRFSRQNTFDVPVKDPGSMKSFQSLSKLSRNHNDEFLNEPVVGGTHLDSNSQQLAWLKDLFASNAVRKQAYQVRRTSPDHPCSRSCSPAS